MTPQLHARNQDFRWRASPPPYDLLTADQAASYDAQGYFLLVGAYLIDAPS